MNPSSVNIDYAWFEVFVVRNFWVRCTTNWARARKKFGMSAGNPSSTPKGRLLLGGWQKQAPLEIVQGLHFSTQHQPLKTMLNPRQLNLKNFQTLADIFSTTFTNAVYKQTLEQLDNFKVFLSAQRTQNYFKVPQNAPE